MALLKVDQKPIKRFSWSFGLFRFLKSNNSSFDSDTLGLRPLGGNKTSYILLIFHFSIRGKLSI